MFTCLFRGHDKKILRICHYNDISYGHKKGLPSTVYTWKCIRCGKIDYNVLYGCGYLTKEEIE